MPAGLRCDTVGERTRALAEPGTGTLIVTTGRTMSMAIQIRPLVLPPRALVYPVHTLCPPSFSEALLKTNELDPGFDSFTCHVQGVQNCAVMGKCNAWEVGLRILTFEANAYRSSQTPAARLIGATSPLQNKSIRQSCHSAPRARLLSHAAWWLPVMTELCHAVGGQAKGSSPFRSRNASEGLSQSDGRCCFVCPLWELEEQRGRPIGSVTARRRR